MVNRKFNGQDIGDSAVSFFEKLAKLERGGKYDLERYPGRYGMGSKRFKMVKCQIHR